MVPVSLHRISNIFFFIAIILFILLIQLQLHLQLSTQNRTLLAFIENCRISSEIYPTSTEYYPETPTPTSKKGPAKAPKKVTVDLDEILAGPLAQDDTRIINYINSSKILIPPSKEKYNLNSSKIDPSMGQSTIVKQIFKNKRNGFFVESGAWDGETRSNTLNLEKEFGWKGLLIEPDPSNFQLLLKKQRKAWAANVCLATKDVPHQVLFKQDFNEGKIIRNIKFNSSRRFRDKRLVKVQCFPLFSMLASLKVHTVDYFSLDVEGSEFKVLQNIPFDRILIKVLSVEYFHIKLRLDESKRITEFLKTKGYRAVTTVNNYEDSEANDLIFAHNSVEINEKIEPIQTR